MAGAVLAALSQLEKYVYVTETLGLWNEYHNRGAVYDGTPMPADKAPITYDDCVLWRAAKKKGLLAKSSSL